MPSGVEVRPMRCWLTGGRADLVGIHRGSPVGLEFDAPHHGPCALSPGMGCRNRQSGQMLHVGAVREGSRLGRDEAVARVDCGRLRQRWWEVGGMVEVTRPLRKVRRPSTNSHLLKDYTGICLFLYPSFHAITPATEGFNPLMSTGHCARK